MGSAKNRNSPWRGKIIKDKLLRRIEPLLSYCQSRNNRELRIHGDIDVIFSPRCAVASVTGLIRDVQQIFLIKSRATHVQPIHPNFPFNSTINFDWSGKLFISKIYTASIGFLFFLSFLFFSYWFLLNIGEQIFSVNSRRWSNGWSYICRSYFRSSHLRLNSLIKDIYIYISRISRDMYAETSFHSHPSQSQEEKFSFS